MDKDVLDRAYSGDESDMEDRSAAYHGIATDLQKNIALGNVPHLGQAINVYDTLQSAIALHNAASTADRQDAQFDLLMAVIGWIPGPGNGLKQSLRAANVAPRHYGAKLFDLLRFALRQCRLTTSPHALLKQAFDIDPLRTDFAAIIAAVQGSPLFQNLPERSKAPVIAVLDHSRDNLPAILEIAQARLTQWIALQPNNSAAGAGAGLAQQREKPVINESMSTGNSPANTAWLELNLHYENLEPVSGAPYRLVFADESTHEGVLDEEGFARLEGIPEGPVKVYYGEDPRPFTRERITVLQYSEQTLGDELSTLELDPDEVDLPALLEHAAHRLTLRKLGLDPALIELWSTPPQGWA